jgi:hypothetical protein
MGETDPSKGSPAAGATEAHPRAATHETTTTARTACRIGVVVAEVVR